MPLAAVRRVARGVRHRARVHQAPRPLAERQGRAHERDARAGAAARAYASEGERAAALSSFIDRHDWGPPRLGQAPQRLRGSPADISYLRCRQRHGTQQLASDGLEVTSGNCFSDELFAQVISIIPESCRLFSPVRPGLARWRSRFGPAPRASDYSSRSFPQVGWAAGVYRLPAAVTGMGGANRVLSPVPAGTRVPGAFRALGNKRKRR